MNIDYEITRYFDDNNLFDSNEKDGLMISYDFNSLIIKGNSRDLVELADILISLSKSKDNNHIHLDDLTLINKDSLIKDIIIEK